MMMSVITINNGFQNKLIEDIDINMWEAKGWTKGRVKISTSFSKTYLKLSKRHKKLLGNIRNQIKTISKIIKLDKVDKDELIEYEKEYNYLNKKLIQAKQYFIKMYKDDNYINTQYEGGVLDKVNRKNDGRCRKYNWVNKECINKQVSPDDLNKYLESGWYIGVFKKNRKR